MIGVWQLLDRAGNVWATEHDAFAEFLRAQRHIMQRFLLRQHAGDENPVGPLDVRVF